jgi:pyruvate ferredoxin oxidoreductase alpha subunit
MVVTMPYPKTAFTVNCVHNLFQNGAATLSGLLEACRERIRRGELEDRDITFVMVSGDGGLDIGLGSAIGAALRNHRMIIFEYDNGGYMNTGYQLSYSTPMGAKSATSHVGAYESGKSCFHKDNPQIFVATGIPYVATCSESNPADFIKKAAKASYYAKSYGLSYIKAVSACPLNHGDNPRYERKVADMAVKCCYHPLYEVERGITHITYNPELNGDKIPVGDWLKMMGRTRHLLKPEYAELLKAVQNEVDLRWLRLKARNDSKIL